VAVGRAYAKLRDISPITAAIGAMSGSPCIRRLCSILSFE
jgi:hypothetical protein